MSNGWSSMSACRSPISANRCGHREDGEVVGHAVVDLVPADRRRHAGLGHAPDRVGGGDRVVARVLVVVDEELRGVAVLAPPRRRDLSPGPPLDLACERQRAAAYVLEAVVGRDPHVDVHPRPAAGLGEADGTELVEHLVGDVGDPLHGGPVALRTRVEVDAPLVGLLGVGAPAVPRVELDRRHLHRPDDARQLGHAQLVGGALPPREEQLDGLDPLGCSGRQALLVHLVARQALGEAVQHARTLEERVDDPVADGEVVVDEVELGRAARRRVGGREVDAVGVGDLDDAVVDLDLGERRRHVTEPSRARRRVAGVTTARRPPTAAARAAARGCCSGCWLLPVLLLGLLVAGLRLLRLVHGHGDDVGPALVGVLALGTVPAELGGLRDGYDDARDAVARGEDGLADRGPLAAGRAGLQDERVAREASGPVGDPSGELDLLVGLHLLPAGRHARGQRRRPRSRRSSRRPGRRRG